MISAIEFTLLSYNHDNVCQPEYNSYQNRRKYTYYLYGTTKPDQYNHDNATPGNPDVCRIQKYVAYCFCHN